MPLSREDRPATHRLRGFCLGLQSRGLLPAEQTGLVKVVGNCVEPAYPHIRPPLFRLVPAWAPQCMVLFVPAAVRAVLSSRATSAALRPGVSSLVAATELARSSALFLGSGVLFEGRLLPSDPVPRPPAQSLRGSGGWSLAGVAPLCRVSYLSFPALLILSYFSLYHSHTHYTHTLLIEFHGNGLIPLYALLFL